METALNTAIEGLNKEKSILTDAMTYGSSYRRMELNWRLREIDKEIRTLLAPKEKETPPSESSPNPPEVV